MKTYPCTRCEGKGEIPHYSNVLGGVCFKCGGSGTQEEKPSAAGIRFTVSAVSKATGERVSTICFLKAPNEIKALAKAKVQLAGGNGYIAETAEVRAA